ncbi:type II toxin-antitoxin system VapB family antitoxin [Rhodopila globiformis]|uniref:DUF2191 domain-containing protein n=1 Tax=Rhodopila globiformis TaxID=1071 RepID=A0A2S6N1G1_RHOGL|nr:type II toxin-antitoxin system VapB family antitoxin [Rhodopila globiformis]PPQ28457.1 hypothetical protein CCS01_24275 [Rhodopila globiformis]
MRITIDIDDALPTEALRVTGASTRKAVVEDMIGLGWDGDLEASREGRS